jgi:hypothetical protein
MLFYNCLEQKGKETKKNVTKFFQKRKTKPNKIFLKTKRNEKKDPRNETKKFEKRYEKNNVIQLKYCYLSAQVSLK